MMNRPTNQQYSPPNAPSDSTAGARILVVDDDPIFGQLLKRWLESGGYRVDLAGSGEAALDLLTRQVPDAVCLDMVLPGYDGVQVLEQISSSNPHLPIVLMTGAEEEDVTERALRAGAFDFLSKPLERTKLLTVIRNAVTQWRLARRLSALQRADDEVLLPGVIGRSTTMRRLAQEIRDVAPSTVSVLLHGETGTGKELIAKAVHDLSPRSKGPLIAVNCGAVPENLADSELFGHERSAFTGALQRRIGRIEQAAGGTLFLDEVAELPMVIQTRLLRVLQDRRYFRLGGDRELASDFRLVAASHRNLLEAVRRKEFREDLYYRLAGWTVSVPPLRERDGDVLLLAEHMLERFAQAESRPKLRLTPAAADALLRERWPGNVRELQAMLHRAVIRARSDWVDLPELGLVSESEEPPLPSFFVGRTLADVESLAIRSSHTRHDGRIALMAEELGVARTTLYRKVRALNLEAGEDPADL
jgi:DNA-binding NtrC family response regulator